MYKYFRTSINKQLIILLLVAFIVRNHKRKHLTIQDIVGNDFVWETFDGLRTNSYLKANRRCCKTISSAIQWYVPQIPLIIWYIQRTFSFQFPWERFICFGKKLTCAHFSGLRRIKVVITSEYDNLKVPGQVVTGLPERIQPNLNSFLRFRTCTSDQALFWWSISS